MTVARRVDVASSVGAYEVRIGRGILDSVGQVAAQVRAPKTVAVVTDEHVGPLYADAVRVSLASAHIDSHEIVVPAGERSKSWRTAGRVLEEMASAGIGRDDAVIALGGGVVGDLAGFCAASFMRGIPFVQVPTTLLAQVDSSVGGKTGVDLAAGKNLAGAFHAPLAVVADTATLDTLDEGAWSDGLAEIVKTAFLAGDPFLSWLEERMEILRTRDSETVLETVETCVRFKADVVGLDEREARSREQLNLGHTLGHAVERLEGYGGVSHGVAVALGLRFAAMLAEHHAEVAPAWRARQEALLDASGIPIPDLAHDSEELLASMHTDKKVREGIVRFVLSTGPGVFEVAPVEDTVLADALAIWESSIRGT